MLTAWVGAVAALAILTILPGPDVAVVTRTALSQGRAAALRTSFGIVSGLFVWGVLAVAGLAALLAASATAYTWLKVIGAAYLIGLGLLTLWRSRRTPAPDLSRVRSTRPFLTGLLSNVTNPKIAVFYTSLLPGLVPSGAPQALGMLLLVVVHAVMGVVWLGFYASVIVRAAGTLQRPRVRQALDRVTGTVLIGFGVRVAVR